MLAHIIKSFFSKSARVRTNTSDLSSNALRESNTSSNTDLSSQYISLLKKSLLNDLYIENEAIIWHIVSKLANRQHLDISELVQPFLNIRHSDIFPALEACKLEGLQPKFTVAGVESTESTVSRNLLANAHTMIGRRRIDNIHHCMEELIKGKVPGDFIETGVWRGGATILMRGILKAYAVNNRRVWVADSFAGLPKPERQQDNYLDFSKDKYPYLAVSLDEVRNLFARYDLLDDQVKFLKGWFSETLPNAPIEKLALLRLDGDLYESTRDSLSALYDRVSHRGIVIVDDYYSFPGCSDAVNEFRTRFGITSELIKIDQASVFWRKQ